MEKHHLASTFNLMRNQEQYNFLIHQPMDNVHYFRRLVTECVIATDLAKSMAWLSSARLSLINDTSTTLNIDEKKMLENKILRMQLVMKCGDVSHPARPLSIHLEWSKLVCEEFYNQGDLERNRGVKVSALCDRNICSSQYAQGQIGFINFVSKPIFSLLSAACQSDDEYEKPWMFNLDTNLKHWEIITSSDNTPKISKTVPEISKIPSKKNLLSNNMESNRIDLKSAFENLAENKVPKSNSVLMHLLFVSIHYYLH